MTSCTAIQSAASLGIYKMIQSSTIPTLHPVGCGFHNNRPLFWWNRVSKSEAAAASKEGQYSSQLALLYEKLFVKNVDLKTVLDLITFCSPLTGSTATWSAVYHDKNHHMCATRNFSRLEGLRQALVVVRPSFLGGAYMMFCCTALLSFYYGTDR